MNFSQDDENHTVGAPYAVQHNVHVDKEFRWESKNNSENTPEQVFQLEEKIGGG